VNSRAVFAALLGVVALLRLLEVVVSRVRQRARPEQVVAEPFVFPLMVALHVGLVALPLLEVILWERPFFPPLALAAGAVLVIATLLRVWTLWTIGAAWNVRVVIPEARQIVVAGPYSWVRHPNYLVVILEVLALPLLHAAWLSALSLSLLNGFVLWRRIRTEEEALRRLPAWRSAMAKRARLIPGLV